MAELFETEFRTVIEDARTRHAAVLALIYFTDQQAMGLMRLFMTVGIATASGAAAGLTSSTLLPRPAGWALLAATLVFSVGAALCLMAMRSANINLPGRGADFWLWALDEAQVDREKALRAYLANLRDKLAMNNQTNARSAAALTAAKWCAALAPLAALLSAAAAAIGGF